MLHYLHWNFSLFMLEQLVVTMHLAAWLADVYRHRWQSRWCLHISWWMTFSKTRCYILLLHLETERSEILCWHHLALLIHTDHRHRPRSSTSYLCPTWALMSPIVICQIESIAWDDMEIVRAITYSLKSGGDHPSFLLLFSFLPCINSKIAIRTSNFFSSLCASYPASSIHHPDTNKTLPPTV